MIDLGSTEGLIVLAVIATGLISLIGISILLINERRLKKSLYFLVSLSAGALFGDALFHLLPESFEIGLERDGNYTVSSLLVIAGILFLFVLEKILHWHHHHTENDEDDVKIHPVGPLVLIADVIHNIIDGVVIAASFYVSTALGVATTLAVMLHEIPHEIGNVSLLVHAGYSRMKAIMYNCFSAFSSLLGAILVIIFADRTTGLVDYLVPFAAGTFIYIAGSDLVPELHKDIGIKKTLIQVVGISIGVIAMFSLLFLE